MNAKYPDLAALILAGGRNTRMGGMEKSRIAVNGTPLVHSIASLLQDLFSEVILVTNRPDLHRDLAGQLIISEDIYRERGPLGGIHTGLARTSKEALFCVACDMPSLDPELIEREIEHFLSLPREQCDALIPRVGELIEPLHAVYRRRLESLAREILLGERGYSVRVLLDKARTCYLDLHAAPEVARAFFNLNTPKDIHLHLDAGRQGGS